MTKYIWILSILVLSACSSEETELDQTTPDTTHTATTIEEPVRITAKDLTDTLNQADPASLSRAIHFLKTDKRALEALNCDSNLVELKNFAIRSADVITELGFLESRVDPETYALPFEEIRKLKKLGFIVQNTEGMYFLMADPGYLLKEFKPCLSGDMVKFMEQSAIETEQLAMADAGISIPWSDVGERFRFWDNFMNAQHDFMLEDEANANRYLYLSLMLKGLDNTPAFSYETKMIDTELLRELESIANNHHTALGKEIKSYLSVLSQNNFMPEEPVLQKMDALLKKAE